ncbi:cell separation during budding [Umbelopsis sp. WA50703]
MTEKLNIQLGYPPMSEHREGLTTEAHDWTMIQAGTLIKGQKVITIDGSLPVEEACEILIKHNISSAPVYDSAPSESTTIDHPKSFIGMFDYADLISYLLIVLRKEIPPEDESTLEIKELVRRAMDGERVPVKLASDLSRKNPFCSVLPEATLVSILDEFACATHRVAVMQSNGNIMGILSQSRVIEHLYKNIRHFPDLHPLVNKSLRQLGLGEAPVVSVEADAIVLDALSLMNKHGVSSLAVIGPNNSLVGNVSMTDVKHIVRTQQKLLWSTCFHFLSAIRINQGVVDGQDRHPVFEVKLDTSLLMTMGKLVATKAHRLWVTDESEAVIGLVSLTDILRAISKSTTNQ